MKRVFSLLLCLVLAMGLLSGCGPSGEEKDPPAPAPEELLSVRELAEAALPRSGKEEGLEVERLDRETDGERLAAYIETVCGLKEDQWEDAAVIRGTGASAFEIVVLRLGDEDAAAGLETVLAEYLTAREGAFTGYAPAEAEMAANGLVRREERTVGLFICPDPEGAGETFRSILETGKIPEPPRPEPVPVQEIETEPAMQVHENPEGPPFVEIAKDVFVTEAMWPEPEGEPDPDYPGRIRYVPTGNELMKVYDTSAIVSAWQTGDASGLSDYDRAIYDNAKAILEAILQDGMSDFEKEVEIYDWVLRNVTYDESQMDVLEETARDAYTPYGGLVNRSGVCLGYASAFQLLMELAGVECITVVGVGLSTEDHAWNMVRLNGEWYCADVTWDWGYYLSGMMNGREWRYFNTTSDYLARSNHQWDYDAVPEATAEDHGAPAVQ